MKDVLVEKDPTYKASFAGPWRESMKEAHTAIVQDRCVGVCISVSVFLSICNKATPHLALCSGVSNDSQLLVSVRMSQG